MYVYHANPVFPAEKPRTERMALFTVPGVPAGRLFTVVAGGRYRLTAIIPSIFPDRKRFILSVFPLRESSLAK